MKIGIVTDSTCDLPKNIIENFGIHVIPLFINIGNQGFLDGLEITRKDFYTNLPNYPHHPTTGTPGIETFKQAYQALATKGCEKILSIHISRSLSATVDVAGMAAQEFKEIPVTVRDSGQLSIGTGFQVEAAAHMAGEGKSMNEITAALDDLGSRSFVTARLDTLEYLRRSGRMHTFLAGLGSLLQLKPILTMKNGQPGSERVRTTRKADNRLIDMLKRHQPIERFALLHTNAQQQANEFLSKIRHLLTVDEIHSMDITPVIGAHIGPGAVGYALVSKHRI